MAVNVEKTSELGRTIRVEVPEEKVDAKVNERLESLTKTVKMDGFRPGKVPVNVIKNRYGQSVRQEIIGDLLNTSMSEALDETQLKMVGSPTIDELSVEPGKPFTFTATFEVFPEVQLGDFSKIEVQKDIVEIKPQDIDETLENIRTQHADWIVVDRAAKNKDRMKIDFEGKVDDKEFPGNKAEGIAVVLGSHMFIPGFEEGLVGKKKGDETVLALEFPKDYQAKELAGKPVKFAIKVLEVSEPKLPEFDEEFLLKLGVKEGGVDALKEQIKRHMQRELDNVVRYRIKNQVFEQLVKLHDFAVPKILLKNEMEQALKDQFRGNEEAVKAALANPTPDMHEVTKRRVMLGLIVAEILQQNDIKASEEKMLEILKNVASSYESPDEFIQHFMRQLGDDKQRQHFEHMALEEQVVDLILGKAKVKESTRSYQEFMKEKK